MKAFWMPVAAVALCATSLGAMAKDEVMVGVLKERSGKNVTVVLAGGTEVTGKVSNVGNNTLRLTELSGKEYFDAVIDLDDVSAVIFRSRDK
ncbi:MAG: uncharacterized protein K0Q76_2332 [Panacagrimonas sp.]|jgi:hypothetical protein|nr:hypothetical protein [Panacagrimonas sp.]MCC2657224.1 uncharacterized protein [Panacagrimonas sp.]